MEGRQLHESVWVLAINKICVSLKCPRQLHLRRFSCTSGRLQSRHPSNELLPGGTKDFYREGSTAKFVLPCGECVSDLSKDKRIECLSPCVEMAGTVKNEQKGRTTFCQQKQDHTVSAHSAIQQHSDLSTDLQFSNDFPSLSAQ